MSRAYRELVEAHPEIYGILDDGLAQFNKEVHEREHQEWLKDQQAQREYQMWLDDLNGRTR